MSLNSKVGYLVGEFPKLSETFVLDEIKEHLRHQVSIIVVSMYRPAANSKVWSNLADVQMPIVYVYRTRGRLQRIERLLIGMLALLRYWRLWQVVFGAGFGSYADRINILGLAYRLGEIRQLGGIDLLHCHFGYRGHLAAALRSLGLIDAKIITTFHGFDLSAELNRKGRNFYDLLFRFGELFLPVSEMWAHRLLELGCDPGRIAVHHVGIDCARNEFKERHLEPRSNKPVRLISVGRLVEKKGHIYTLRALARLREQNPALSITLDIVGDGPLLDTLRHGAFALQVDDIVVFHGGLSHNRTLALLDHAAIFVLPSVTAEDGDMEGIPVSLMEAMARGLVVISTFHSGIPELIEDGVNGFLVPEKDTAALANAIEQCVKNARIWPDLLRAGRRTVEAKFDRRKLGDRLIELYRGLLLQRRLYPRVEQTSRAGR